MKNILLWFGIIFALFVVAITIYQNWPAINLMNLKMQDEVKIEPNDWQVVQSIDLNDSLRVIKVVYQEKYGSERIVFCNAIFENKKTSEYKCIAPWLEGLVLEKSNVNAITYNKVTKGEMNTK